MARAAQRAAVLTTHAAVPTTHTAVPTTHTAVPTTHAVILTKVRTQGYRRRGAWLWVLTFVRMTVEVRRTGRRAG